MGSKKNIKKAGKGKGQEEKLTDQDGDSIARLASSSRERD